MEKALPRAQKEEYCFLFNRSEIHGYVGRQMQRILVGYMPLRIAKSLNYNHFAEHPLASQNENLCASKTFSQTQQSGEFCRINSLRWSASSGSALKPWN